jgi:antitoxin (DNA-binding transcriptional repressor) of toxin-antitoxin stability system
MSTVVTIDEAKAQFESLVGHVRDRKVEFAIVQAGEVIARIVPPTTYRGEARQRFFSKTEELQRKFSSVSPDELESMIDRAVEEVRSRRKRRVHA